MRKIRHLDLRNCTQLTDAALHHIAHYLGELVHLDMSWCQNLTDNGLDRRIEFEHTQRLLNEFNRHVNGGSCRCARKYAEQPFLLIRARAEIALEIRNKFCDCTNVEDSIALVAEPAEGAIVDGQQERAQVQANEDALASLPSMSAMDLTLKSLRNLRVLKLEACINVTDMGLQRGFVIFFTQAQIRKKNL